MNPAEHHTASGHSDYAGEESETRTGAQRHRAQACPLDDHHLPSISIEYLWRKLVRVEPQEAAALVCDSRARVTTLEMAFHNSPIIVTFHI